jgi:hypothetical protein
MYYIGKDDSGPMPFLSFRLYYSIPRKICQGLLTNFDPFPLSINSGKGSGKNFENFFRASKIFAAGGSRRQAGFAG